MFSSPFFSFTYKHVNKSCSIYDLKVFLSKLHTPFSLFIQILKLILFTLGLYESAHSGRSCLLWHTLTHKVQTQSPTLRWSLPLTTAWGKHSFKLLWWIINVGRHSSIVPGDMIFACLDLILSRNCHRLVNTCKGNFSSWEISLHLGITSGPANKLKFLKGWVIQITSKHILCNTVI